ncbi:MAG: energy transducer TonB [Chloroflexia bacterium]|nr:energy transducer TonB [Chloroflexia bacterium]
MIAAENGIQGKVFVQFSVNNIGELEDIKIVKGVHDLLDKEALRVVNLSPYWEPGFQFAIPVKVQFTFPITFALQ